MRLPVLFNRRVIGWTILALVVLLLGTHGSPPKAEARGPVPGKDAFAPYSGPQDSAGDAYACWTSGRVGADDDASWGVDHEEFAVDTGEISELRGREYILDGDDYLSNHRVSASDPRLTGGLTQENLDVFSLYATLPELVDYGMYVDVFNTASVSELKDRRVQMLRDVLQTNSPPVYDISPSAYANNPDEERRLLLPWIDGVVTDDLEDYRLRRSLGAHYDAGVTSFSSGWHDPSNPSGGVGADYVAMARDQLAGWVDLTEGTTSHAGGGGVTHIGTTEVVAQQFTQTRTSTCSGTSCSETTTLTSNPQTVTAHVNMREQNDGQFEENVTGAGERTILVSDGTTDASGNLVRTEQTVELDPRLVPPSSLPYRHLSGPGYSRQFQEDTDADELRISIRLREDYREDIPEFFAEAERIKTVRPLPAMGRDPWTYALGSSSSSNREAAHNEWPRVDNTYVGSAFVHSGYRQPSLSRPYRTDGSLYPVSSAMTRSTAEHIRWPVNLEDLNWYLYRLPTDGYRSPLWVYWLTPTGTNFVVNSAYGTDALDFPADGSAVPSGSTTVPHCPLEAESDYSADLESVIPLAVNESSCKNLPTNWSLTNIRDGALDNVHFPFDYEGTDDDRVLNDTMLVRRGAESPEDSDEVLGVRDMTRFDFSILESSPLGDVDRDRGADWYARHGMPNASGLREAHQASWPGGPINPNLPYLMVVTFYEADVRTGELQVHLPALVEGGEIVPGYFLPKRYLRRVVCRMLVYPSGFDPSEVETKSVVEKLGGTLFGWVDDLFSEVMSVVSRVTVAVAKAPVQAGVKTTELVCAGMSKVDGVMDVGDAGPSNPTVVDQDGRLVVNAAVASREDGRSRCHRISSPEVSTCDAEADLIFRGECIRLPEFKLGIRKAEFVDPPSPGGVSFYEYRRDLPPEAHYRSYGEEDFMSVAQVQGVGFSQPVFDKAPDPVGPGTKLTPYNRGLTRLYLDWDYRWQGISPRVSDVISGFVVKVFPDQRSVAREVPEEGFSFVLPKWVRVTVKPSGSPKDFYRYRVDGFSVGGLDHYPSEVITSGGSEPLVDLGSLGVGITAADIVSNRYVTARQVSSHPKIFNQLLENMPLAPGFTHGFQVAPYVGSPGDPSYRVGPFSEMLWLVGERAACDEVTDPASDVDRIQDLYDCRPSTQDTVLGYQSDGFRPGLLSLTGTDICGDIFSATPALFTWDNPVVKMVWNMVWVVAGSVLFFLLVWQGLRMTYDVWLDPQPAVGFRELLPRFIVALILAWSSLFICKMVLILASDLTCFFAQHTGMTMWGAVGLTFGGLTDGFMSWYENLKNISDYTLLYLLSNFLLLFALAIVVLFVLLFLLYLFAKVFLAMLIRLALLAVLIAVSPLAFAFYASDSTAHWTKKWVSMFLGTTFQQVMVLLVIFIGASMLGAYLASGVETGFVAMVVGMILAFLTLSLAADVPKIVNPASQGLFGSFGEVGKMALAGTMVVTGGVVGGVIGGARGMAAGGAGATPPGGGGGSGGLGPAAPSGGVPSPSGSGPQGVSPGVMSSVSRRPFSGGSAPSGSAGGAVPSGAGSGGAAPGGGYLLTPSGAGATSSSESESQPGFFRRVASGAAGGARSGARRAANVNYQAGQLASGRAFYQSQSPGAIAERERIAEMRRAAAEAAASM